MSHTRNDKGQPSFEQTAMPRINSLIRALQADEPEPITCAECRQHLPDLYHLRVQLQIQLQGEEVPLAAEHQIYTAHLAGCPDCAMEYSILCEVMNEFEEGTLPALDQAPQFDLSFMDSVAEKTESRDAPLQDSSTFTAPSPLWRPALGNDLSTDLTNGLHAGLHTLVEEVAVVIQSTKATFGALSSLFNPTLVPSALMRGEESNRQAELLVLPAPDADLSLHLSVGPVVGGYAAIAVKLLEMSTARPLGETRVTLRNGQRQLLIGSVTGQDGMLVFEQLALGRYFVQVRHKQQTWEIPLVLVEGALADGADAL